MQPIQRFDTLCLSTATRSCQAVSVCLAALTTYTMSVYCPTALEHVGPQSCVPVYTQTTLGKAREHRESFTFCIELLHRLLHPLRAVWAAFLTQALGGVLCQSRYVCIQHIKYKP